nr:hypothetical protein FAC7G5_18 [Penicillium fuscum]
MGGGSVDSRLCSVSSQFRELLNGDASSGGTKELYMLDDNPRVWHWFQIWLREGRLKESYDLTRSGWVNFLTLYFFAEEKAVLQLQNQLMDVMGDLIQRVAPDPEMVNRIWSKTGPRSALRGLIIEGFVYEFHATTVLRYHKYDNTQFLQDLIHYYQDISAPLTNQARKPFMVPCRYHVHEAADPPCPQAHGVFARAKFGMLKFNAPPGPMVTDSRFNGTENFGYTGTIPSLPDTGPESDAPRPPMIAEVIESPFNGTGQCDNTGTIPSVPNASPEINVPRGLMVEEEPGSHFSGTGKFDTTRSIPFFPDAWNPGW